MLSLLLFPISFLPGRDVGGPKLLKINKLKARFDAQETLSNLRSSSL
jgi:hypothetical protein